MVLFFILWLLSIGAVGMVEVTNAYRCVKLFGEKDSENRLSDYIPNIEDLMVMFLLVGVFSFMITVLISLFVSACADTWGLSKRGELLQTVTCTSIVSEGDSIMYRLDTDVVVQGEEYLLSMERVSRRISTAVIISDYEDEYIQIYAREYNPSWLKRLILWGSRGLGEDYVFYVHEDTYQELLGV